jgi:Ser/Thr protein kinase RdoA (MazF antagonist)
MDDAETPLVGGRVTAGVTRVGETVRRPISGDRTLQHNLLAHLEQRGFAGCPRFLGIDELGREVLSWLPGHVPAELGHYTDAQLSAAARMLRGFHDATADFAPVQEQAAEVMCHNDFGPCNTVFSDAIPCAIIDFDTIAPGLHLWDLGYSAWLWLDIGDPDLDYSADEQLRRLTVFEDAYGLSTCSVDQIAAFMLARQATLATWAKGRGHVEMAAWATSAAEWTVSNIIDRLLPTAFPE